VLLCMPASVRWGDAVRATKAFAAAKPVAVAVTKTDETDAPAGILHAVLASKLPLSILCTGPRVPEDIEAATPIAVTNRVVGPKPQERKPQ
jgi:flagellar biosynthesis protein FlhF